MSFMVFRPPRALCCRASDPGPEKKEELMDAPRVIKRNFSIYHATGRLTFLVHAEAKHTTANYRDINIFHFLSGVYYLSSKHWLGIILIVLVGGAVGVALPYALRVQEGTTFDDRLALASSLLKQVPLIDG